MTEGSGITGAMNNTPPDGVPDSLRVKECITTLDGVGDKESIHEKESPRESVIVYAY